MSFKDSEWGAFGRNAPAIEADGDDSELEDADSAEEVRLQSWLDVLAACCARASIRASATERSEDSDKSKDRGCRQCT